MMSLLSGQIYFSLISSCPGAGAGVQSTRQPDDIHCLRWFILRAERYLEITPGPLLSLARPPAMYQQPPTPDPTTVLLDTSSLQSQCEHWALIHCQTLTLTRTYSQLGLQFNSWLVNCSPDKAGDRSSLALTQKFLARSSHHLVISNHPSLVQLGPLKQDIIQLCQAGSASGGWCRL